MRNRLTLLTLVLTAAATAAVRQDMLVSTEWLAQHIKDANVVVIQVSRERAAFDAGHIPGARFVALSDIAITRDGVPNELPAADLIEKTFEKAGVSDDSHVILYTDAAVLPATRAWFTLDYIGHGPHTSLLDGGLQKWRAEGRAIATDSPTVETGRLTAFPRKQVLADMDMVRYLATPVARNTPGSAVLVDARPVEDYTGSRPNAELKQPGHIAGAVNLNWGTTQVKDSSALLPEAELRKLYEGIGVKPERPVVTYCNSGMQASQAYFVLKYLGYDVKLYDGSLSEWTLKNAPVQTGAKP